jgi:hypothetical protein
MENEKQVITLLTKIAGVVAGLVEARLAQIPVEYRQAVAEEAQELRTLSKAILQPSQPSQGSK